MGSRSKLNDPHVSLSVLTVSVRCACILLLQAMIAAGEVGSPVSAVLQSRDPDAPPFAYVKGGGGLFKDMGEDWQDMT